MTLGTFLVIALAIFLGSTVQSVVGLGIGLVAAPVMTLLEPALMPGTLIMLALVLPAVTLVHDHDDIDWPGLTWSLPARVLGTGDRRRGWSRSFTDRQLGIAIGVMVILMVLVTWRSWRCPSTAAPSAGPGSSAASPGPRRRSAARRSRCSTCTGRPSRSGPRWRSTS